LSGHFPFALDAGQPLSYGAKCQGSPPKFNFAF
jgi:hypothetical protein